MQRGFDDMLGLGAGNEHGWRNDEIQAPEFLMPGDVLRRDSVGALVDCFPIADLFLVREFAFRMREEMGTVASEGKHEQRLGVQARRADLGRGQLVDGKREGIFQEHVLEILNAEHAEKYRRERGEDRPCLRLCGSSAISAI